MTGKILAALICFSSSANLFSQGFSIKYKAFDLQAEADCQLGLGKIVTGFSVNEFRLRSTATFTHGIQVVGIFKSRITPGFNWYDIGDRSSRLSQLYIQYSNIFHVLKRNLAVNFFAGRLVYYPVYSEPKFYFDNIGFFDLPQIYYGADLKAYYKIVKKNNLNFFVDVNSGALTGLASGYKTTLNEVYVCYTPRIIDGIYVQAKVGKYPGYLYAVNEGYLFYDKQIKAGASVRIKPIGELGRLPSYDISPYGFRLGMQILTNYFLLGAYYEKRMNVFNFPEMHYIAVYFSILKPKIVADILRRGTILYDPGTQSLRFKIPIVNLHF